MQFRAPPGGAPATVPGDAANSIACNYNATGSTSLGPATPNSSSNCTITTKTSGGSGGIYNGLWLRVRISIPTTYSCTTDCWWTVKYDFGAGGFPTDRTVWSLQVVGDPVHLVG